jgi:hypothetical protein
MHAGGIFCDLAKAFDCGNHDILLTELHFFGIQGRILSWLRSYLTNRKQKIEIVIKFKPTYLLKLRNNKTWSSAGINFKRSAFHNIYK